MDTAHLHPVATREVFRAGRNDPGRLFPRSVLHRARGAGYRALHARRRDRHARDTDAALADGRPRQLALLDAWKDGDTLMGQKDILYPGLNDPRRKPTKQVLASQDDITRLAGETHDQLQTVATQAGLALAALQGENLTRQQEIAQWGVEHLVLLRVLVRRGVITEDDLRAEREAVRADVEAAQSEPGEDPSPVNEA